MNSYRTANFRKLFERLPAHVQRQARETYKLFTRDPYHPSLHFKQVHPTRSIYSVRFGGGYRAVGVRAENEIVWFWIGSHNDYDKLLKQL